MNCLDAALEYTEMGLSIIPLQPKGKKPLIEWREFQDRIASAEEIESWFEKTPDANIGLVTGSVSGVVVIDADSKEATRWMRESIPRAVMYQKTGKGWHALFKGNGRPVPNSASLIYDKADIRGDGGYIVIAPSVHPNGKQYELTSPTGGSWEDLTEFPYDLLKTTSHGDRPKVTLDPVEKGARDDTLVRVAGKYCAMGLDEQAVLALLIGINSRYKPPLPEGDLQRIVGSIFKKEESKGKQRKAEESKGKPREAEEIDRKAGKHDGLPINQLVSDFVDENTGEFSTTDIDREYSFLSRGEKNARSVALNKLAKSGKVKKVQGKAGRWKIVKGDIQPMKLGAIAADPLDLELPLGISRLAAILPGNIVLVAGSPNSGKTAFLLSSLSTLLLKRKRKEPKEKENNKEKKKDSKNQTIEDLIQNGIRYLNSEMDEAELTNRCLAFPNGFELFSEGCQFFQRYKDFADVIIPNGVNFIDFLEIHEDFFELGKLINEIFENLTSGICFIAVQKKQGADYAKGGASSLEKPRLVVNLDRNEQFGKICKIVKCKKPVKQGDNHDGKECDFDVAGYKLERYSSFRYVDQNQRKLYNKDYEVRGLEVIPDKEYAFIFPLTTGKSARITPEQVDKWDNSFPGVDVNAELRRIESDSRRKPFLDKNWFHALPGMFNKKTLF